MATITGERNFNADGAANALRSAMKGLGTDEDTIIKILTSHSNHQRQDITAKYKMLFGRELIDDLKSELGGNLEDVILALMDPFPLFLAKELKAAMKGAGTDENTLIEIIVPRPNNEIRAIKAHYEKEFGSKLEDDIKGDVSGHFECLLLSLCQGSRDESNEVDSKQAEVDAKALADAGINTVGTNEDTFNSIFCSRNFNQLKATFDKYKNTCGKTIIESIESEMTGTLEAGFKALAMYVLDSNAYFAERLHVAMAGAGTDDKSLIRLIVTRSEFDLKSVSQAYQRIYKKLLQDAIRDDCRGDYCKTLLAILGNN